MGEKGRFERKHFFIDRKLQGRYMLAFFVPLLIMLVFMIFTLYVASQSVINTAAKIVKDDIQNVITLQLHDTTEPSADEYKKLLQDINTYLRTFNHNTKYRQTVLSTLLWVFGIGIMVVIIQLVLLTIFFSHKIAGPVYRFEVVCHNIINGNYTDTVQLRKGDEMQNLARLLNEVIQQTRKRFHGLISGKSEEKEKIVETIKL